MHHIRRRLLAVAAIVIVAARAVPAQDSTAIGILGQPVFTSGIEDNPSADTVVALPSPSCPLTKNQLVAVRAGVGSAFIGGNAYLYHYFK
ncbi:MAG: hypothetical protein ACJ79B_04900, partial [Gemmatimonadaceae bacterium]